MRLEPELPAPGPRSLYVCRRTVRGTAGLTVKQCHIGRCALCGASVDASHRGLACRYHAGSTWLLRWMPTLVYGGEWGSIDARAVGLGCFPSYCQR
jgi:hypothetical protein